MLLPSLAGSIALAGASHGPLLDHACCSSDGLRAVVTALVLATSSLPASAQEPVGYVRRRSAPCALLATCRARPSLGDTPALPWSRYYAQNVAT
jgi:hypothetical protein